MQPAKAPPESVLNLVFVVIKREKSYIFLLTQMSIKYTVSINCAFTSIKQVVYYLQFGVSLRIIVSVGFVEYV